MKKKTEEKTIGYSHELEAYILGAVMVHGMEAYERVSDLKARYFHKDTHQWIWEQIETLCDRNIHPDIIAVKNQLSKTDMLKRVGGAHYLTVLTGNVVGSHNIEYFAFHIKTYYAQRRMIGQLDTAMKLAQTADTGQVPVIMDKLSSFFLEITDKVVGKKEQKKVDIAMELMERQEKIRMAAGGISGIPCGIYDVDALTTGFQPKQLYFIGARPGSGKSDFILYAAQHADLQGFPVSIFSLEMSKDRCMDRIATYRARQVKGTILKPNATEAQVSNYNHALGSVVSSKMEFFDGSYTLQRLRYQIRHEVRKGSQAIFIDYLQKIVYDIPANSREDIEISRLCAGLLDIAKECNVPVICVQQMNRNIEKRSGDEPIMSDMHGGSAIEKDADFVMFITRPYKDGFKEFSDGTSTAGYAKLWIKKNRDGPERMLAVYAPQEYGVFYSNSETESFSVQDRNERENSEPETPF